MKNQITVLVVEDRDNHFVDAQRTCSIFTRGAKPIQISVQYARDFEEAMRLYPSANAVMTDVFFPTSPGGPEEPNGQKLVERCLHDAKPVVWVTSTYHHGKKTNSVNEWGREHGMEMFDCRNAKDGEGEHKPWNEAFFGLLGLMIAVEEEFCLFREGKIFSKGYKGEYYAQDCATHLGYFLFESYISREITKDIDPPEIRPIIEKTMASFFADLFPHR